MVEDIRAENEPRTKTTNKRQLLGRLVSIVITVALLVYVVNDVEWRDFDKLLSRVSLTSLSLAMLSYLALNLLRSLRFRVLLDKSDTPMRILIPITLYHNGLVRWLPFKLGELSYIVLLRRRLNYSMEEGVSSLVGARLLEMLIIVLVFAFGIVFSGKQFAEDRSGLIFLTVLVFLLSVIGLYFAGDLIRFLWRAVQRPLGLVLNTQSEFVIRITAKLGEIAIELDRIRHPRLFFSALLISCFTYTSSFLTNYILLRALGLEVGLPIMIIIISIGMGGSAFPFTLSGFGVVEVSWKLGLTLFAGLPDSDASTIGLLLHAFQLIAAALYGLVGYLLIRLTPPLASGGISKQE